MKELASYVGAGAGLTAFFLFGFLHFSFLGGIMGINLAGALFGFPVSSGIFPRLIVSLSMLGGIVLSATMFTLAGTAAGRLVGEALDAVRAMAFWNDKADKADKYAERRRFSRARESAEVKVMAMGAIYEASLVDISESGVGLVFRTAIAINQGDVVNCICPSKRDSARGSMKVAWTSSNGKAFRAGFHFN